MGRKLTNEFIKIGVEKLGYKLASTYVGQLTKITIYDELGYYYVVGAKSLLKNHIPDKFHLFNPYTIQNIKLWAKLNNKPFELLSDTYEGSDKYLRWKCLKEDCREEFDATWNNIINNKGCPYCSGHKVGLSNCLATKNPELIKEWNLIRNGSLTPFDVTWCSGKEVWWKCKKCNHEWKARISNRTSTNKTGCPECKEPKGEKECKRVFDLKNVYYIPQKEFDGLIGLRGGLLSYDFYLPKYNLLIEYQGEYHEFQQSHVSENKFKTQQEHDRRKREYAKDNNIKLLEIWYWDIDKIEKILEKELFI